MSHTKRTILGISGSTRNGSSNENVLKAISEKYKDRFDFILYKQIDGLPHFNPDLDTEFPPQAVLDFRALVEKSDAVIICTPVYVFSLPGSLKNALEWTVSTVVFSDKPVGLIVGSGHGIQTLESLQLIMKTIQAKIGDRSALMLKGIRRDDPPGTISDAEAVQKIDEMMKDIEEALMLPAEESNHR